MDSDALPYDEGDDDDDEEEEEKGGRGRKRNWARHPVLFTSSSALQIYSVLTTINTKTVTVAQIIKKNGRFMNLPP